jgi:hypothetical protein
LQFGPGPGHLDPDDLQLARPLLLVRDKEADVDVLGRVQRGFILQNAPARNEATPSVSGRLSSSHLPFLDREQALEIRLIDILVLVRGEFVAMPFAAHANDSLPKKLKRMTLKQVIFR